MKPWHLYTSEDDEALYNQDFDLAALLSSTAAEPEVKEIQEESPAVYSSPEESLLIQQLHELLERERAELRKQIQLNKAQEQRLNSEERQRQDTGKLKDQEKIHGEIRYLYNTAVTNKVNVKQELISANSVIAKQKNQIEEQDKTIQALKQELKSPKNLQADSTASELKEVKLQLHTNQVKLQEQEKAYGEVRYLYNTAIADKVHLKQDLVSAKSLAVRQKKQIEEQNKTLQELQEKAQEPGVPKVCDCDFGRVSIRTKEQKKQDREAMTAQTALNMNEKEELLQKVKELQSKLYAAQEEVYSLKIERESLKRTLKRREEHVQRPLTPAGVKEQRRHPGHSAHCSQPVRCHTAPVALDGVDMTEILFSHGMFHDPPLLFDLESDPSEHYALSLKERPDLQHILQQIIEVKAILEASMEFGESQLAKGQDPNLQPCCNPECSPKPSCCHCQE
ncbi:hypothetical protein WMY93_023424 [Mugilogobius chulae]|uniref:Uncharacterized protein n=1 Tax=Mugilogobius chulae TaxID=88201 RepID=A0AAW0N5B9_9GOBI